MLKTKKKLLPLISIFLVTGFLLTSLASYFVSRSSLHSEILLNELPLTSDNIYSEIQRDLLRPVFISSLMASDTFLRDWVIAGEQDNARITKYLKEIQDEFRTFTSFFVSEKTRKYYHSDGLLKTVSPDSVRDIWYFRVREMPAEYEINVDIDMANQDTLTIFINYRVYDYDNNYIGATGVGLTVNAVKDLIETYQHKYQRSIYFIDMNGNVKLAGSGFPDDITNIVQIRDNDEIESIIRTKQEHSFKYHRKGVGVHANARYIPEFDWVLIVEQPTGLATRHILTTLIINLVVCAVITIIVLVLVMRAIKKFQIRIETLSGIVPICSYCKQIRDDQGYWNQVEAYISKYTDAEFSHGICPECREKYFPAQENQDNDQ